MPENNSAPAGFPKEFGVKEIYLGIKLGKEVIVVDHMTAHQCDQFPFLVVKGSSSNMNTGTNMHFATSIARKLAFHVNHFSEALVLCKLLQTMKVGDADFAKDDISTEYRVDT